MAKKKSATSFSTPFDNNLYSTNGLSAELVSNPDAKVRFSLKHCSGGKFCMSNVKDTTEAQRIYSTLGYYEDYEWKQIASVRREKGFSIEKRDTTTYKQLAKDFPLFKTFGHFRVTGVPGLGTYRIFGAQEKDLFYILMFDRQGKVHNLAHK